MAQTLLESLFGVLYLLVGHAAANHCQKKLNKDFDYGWITHLVVVLFWPLVIILGFILKWKRN